MAVAAGPCRFDPADIAANIHLGTRKTDVERQIDDGGGDDDVLDPVTERCDHRHRQHEQRKGHQHVDEAADGAIKPPSGITADRADHRADHEGDSDRRDRTHGHLVSSGSLEQRLRRRVRHLPLEPSIDLGLILHVPARKRMW